MLDNETKRRIDTARDILVGKVPDPKSQVEQITIALVYKFMDDMDKDSLSMGGKASFFTGDYERYAWSKIFDPRIGGHELLGLYGEAIVKLNQNPNIPQLFRDIFKNAYLPYRDPETLKLFLKTINEFVYDHSERLGDAFEYLLSVLGSQGDAGQFRTPRHIIDFMVQIVNPQKHEKILDPACGTAGFLISSYKHILKENTKKIPGDLLTGEERKKLLTNFKGYDISPDMVRLSLVNLYLHGFVQPQIVEYDTLTSEDRWNEYADVILANPPFMSPKGGIKPHKKFSVQSNRSEVLFVDYIAEHLTPTGRAAVIVPEGIIFQNAGAYKQLRKMLVENHLYAVVSLPAGIFNPYSGVKTSILLMDRQIAQKSDSILFVKIENDGFGLGAQRREQSGSDLPDAVNVINDYVKAIRAEDLKSFIPEEKPCDVLIVKKEILAENEYNLTGERYKVIVHKGHQKWPMLELMDVCVVESGSRQKGGAVDNGIYSIGGEQISEDNAIRFDKMKYITEEHFAEMKRGILLKGDVLMVKDGATTGKMGYWAYDHKAAVNEHVYIFRANDLVLSKFLFRVLWSEGFQRILKPFIKGIIGGVSLEIQNIKIPIPPLDFQREIVHEIDSFQRIVDGARQIVDTWKPQIVIDPDWPIIKLGELINGKPRNGYSGKPVDYETRWKVLSLSATTQGYLKKEHFKYLDEPFENDFYAICKKGDIYLQRGNTAELVGMPAIFDIEDEGYIFPDLMIRIQPNVQIIDTNYLHTYLLSDRGRNFVTSNATGAAGSMPKINQTIVESIPIPLPPLEIQKEIAAKIECERGIINGCRHLIDINVDKIKALMNKVWEQ
ncbi:MAG: N-6 DNA methylase [Bacteroidales bacterium]|nr:N-6 DNA methylase [Bacteroidales bacterium]